VVPETNDSESLTFEPMGSQNVFLRLPAVLPAIYFDHELSVKRHKVDDIRPNMALPSKLEARQLLSPEISPQPLLRIGHVIS
jgi:hypothetical protein